MRLLSTPEYIATLSKFGGTIDSLQEDFRSSSNSDGVVVNWWGQARASIAIARAIVGLSVHRSECTVTIVEYGIWPSSEDLNLYGRFCSSAGCPKEPSAPILFESDDREDLTTFLNLIIQFGWGAIGLFSTPMMKVVVSHDGWVRVNAAGADDRVAKALAFLPSGSGLR
jgi:hypothetical protein